MKYVLDTNVVLRYPEILSHRVEGHDVYIPEAVVADLNRISTTNPSVRSFLKLIDSSVAAAMSTRVGTPNFGSGAPLSAADLGRGDWELLATALAMARLGEAVSIVSDDADVLRHAREHGIRVMTGAEFVAIAGAKQTSSAVATEAVAARTWLRRSLILNIVTGTLAGFGANVVASHIDQIIATVNVWATVATLPVLGVLLYWFRQRFRLGYGIAEFLVGLLSALWPFFPSFDYSRITSLTMLQIVAGLYVMVRGLDNVGKAIEATRIAPMWRRIFGSP